MNRSTPGLPVHHQLPEFTQTHVHRIGDAIQPSHPLSSPSPPAINPSQHQGLFQWVNSSHEVAKVFEFQIQHQSFQWTSRTDHIYIYIYIYIYVSVLPMNISPSNEHPGLIIYTYIYIYIYIYVNKTQGLPWWSSGKESTLQCRGYRFDPWSGN